MQSRAVESNMPFNEAFNRWISNLEIERAGVVTNARYLSERGIKDLKQYAKEAGRFFGKIPLAKIHAGHLMTYQNARAICDNTVIVDGQGWKQKAGANLIRKEIQIVRRVMQAADCWNKDAMRRTWRELELVVNDVPRALAPREQERFLEVAASRPEWLHVYWYSVIALQTSCSSDELRALRLGDIFLDHGILEIRKGKNGYRKRTIPLQTEQVLWSFTQLINRAKERGARERFHHLFPKHITLNRYDPNQPMTVSGLRKPWEAIRAAAGLPWFRIYDLRHTAITRMAEAGSPIAVIMDIAGHISPAMQRHYTHVSMQSKRRHVSSAWAGAEMPAATPYGAPGAAEAWPAALPGPAPAGVLTAGAPRRALLEPMK